MSGPAADIVAAVLAWAANWEREANRERIATARASRAAKGLPWGRPSRTSAADRLRISHLRDQGKSVRAIATALKIPHATVQRVLSQKPPPKTISRASVKKAA
jgi:DNA invertase Pin-like site-specific DNA recombinase